MDYEMPIYEPPHRLSGVLQAHDAPPLVPEADLDQDAAPATPSPAKPQISLVDELGFVAWVLGMFGTCLAVISRTPMLMLGDSRVTGQGAKDLIALLLPLTLSTGAWFFVACLLGSLIYLRRHLDEWIAFVFAELATLVGSAAIIGLLGSVLLDFAEHESEATREIAAGLGLVLFVGVIFGNLALIGEWLKMADRARAPKPISAPEEPAPQDIILD